MPPHTLRLLSRDNGVGLSRDLRLLASAFATPDVAVDAVAFDPDRRACRRREAALWGRRLLHGRVDVQVSVERVHRRCLPLARRNVLVPNPEWLLDKWRPLLHRFDAVWCKTRHAQRIFDALGCPTRYIGFTSDDRREADVPRERAFFHLAGASATKGTRVLLDAWLRHPEWPRLTVVQSPRMAGVPVRAPNLDHRIAYLDDATLRRLQNAHRFHLCPSETEGFGHYLVEAMSVGAVVLYTDAEPMDELLDPRCGVPVAASDAGPMRLARRHAVDVASIEGAVAHVLALSDAQCDALGAAARARFESQRIGFHARLPLALGDVLAPRNAPARADALSQER
ncbi:MAG TPA: glycosyltransferase [Lysobacter sp.]